MLKKIAKETLTHNNVTFSQLFIWKNHWRSIYNTYILNNRAIIWMMRRWWLQSCLNNRSDSLRSYDHGAITTCNCSCSSMLWYRYCVLQNFKLSSTKHNRAYKSECPGPMMVLIWPCLYVCVCVCVRTYVRNQIIWG